MTAQIHDTILIENQSFSIVGVDGGDLFTPQSVGIYPGPSNSACWRGYVCQYKIENEMLLLDELQVSMMGVKGEGKDITHFRQPGPEINGVQPTSAEGKLLSSGNLYENLNLEIPFTGTILAGDGFIRELYVHMGFHPAWKYEHVLEIKCEYGKVVTNTDISTQNKKIRDMMSQQTPRG